MQKHDVEARDRLEAAFGSKYSEATLIVPIANLPEMIPLILSLHQRRKQGVLSLLLPLFQFTFLGELLSMYPGIWA